MPQLGLGTEIGRVSGGAYDSDALAYFSRAGIASGTQTPSSYDNAASFNGTNQFLSISNASQAGLSLTTAATWSCWFRNGAQSGFDPFIIKSDFSSNQRSYSVSIINGRLTAFVSPDGSGGANTKSYSTVAIFGDNAWHHFCVTFQSNALRLFVDGAEITGAQLLKETDATVNSIFVGNAPVCVGGDIFNNIYLGSLAGVGVWNRVLSPSEVTALFNSGAGRTYASLDSGLLTNLVSWWALNQNSVTADSHGTNTLTNNGSVTATTLGPIVTTTENSRQLINNFVKGIKSLGLWNSMVCWPLRASQNAGGGTTAFSLGGLGQFNGTLAGSVAPSWAPNGVLNSGGGGQINTTLTQAYNAQSIGVVGAQSSPTSGFSYFGANNSAGQNLYWLNPRSGFGGEFRYAGSNIVVGDTSDVTFSLWSTLGSVGSQTTAYKNNVLLGTAASNATTPASTTLSANLILGRENGVFQGTQAFAFVFSVRLSPSNYVLLYNLYRQTLGLGLGLP
jgi:hypothetical protein